MKCAWHLCQNEAVDWNGKGKFCCHKCRNKYFVTENRRKMKQRAIEYKGGKCECCGYDKSHWALEFHHLDPTQKDFGISKEGLSRSWNRIKDEIEKCILVCANCHAEIHHGIRNFLKLPV